MNKFFKLNSNYDFKNNETDIISDSNAKFCYFFYINNISHDFDLDLQDYHFNEDETIDKEDLEEIKNFNKLTKSSVVIKIINSVFNRIASLTTSKEGELFLNFSKDFENPKFIEYDKNNDFSQSILGNLHTNKMYSFVAKVNPNNQLYRFADKLNIMFYLEQDTNRLVGGFTLNKLDNDSNNFDDTLNDFYLSNLINSFITDQLYPYDLELLLDVDITNFDTSDKKDSNLNISQQDIKPLNMDNPNLKLIKDNWEKLIYVKYLKYKDDLSEADIEYYKNTLFYSIMTTWAIIVHIVEELDEYFTSGKEQELISLSSKKEKIVNSVNLSSTEDFLSILNYLRMVKITDVKMRKFDNYSLSSPKLLMDIYSENNLLLLDTDRILSNRLVASYLSLILFKEEYGIDDINSNFLNIDHVRKLIYEDVEKGLSSKQLNNLRSAISSQNFNYISFINKDQILIFHNPSNKENEKFKNIVNYFIWGMVFIISKQLEKDDLVTHTNYIMTSGQRSKVVFFRQIIRDIEDIKFSWDDDFFGVKQIKNVVFTMNKQIRLAESLNELMDRVKNEDEIFKKQTERTSIILSFIIALLIGYVDFLACIFSVLPCSWTVVTWNWILGTIGFTTFTTTVNLLILFATIIYLARLKSRYKNIDSRNKRIRYSQDKTPQYVR